MLKKIFILILGMSFLMIATSACFRVSTVKHERVDLETEGNRGYILGRPQPEEEGVKDRTREIIQIDVDFSDFQKYGSPEEGSEMKEYEEEGEIKKESSTEYNRGYVETKKTQKQYLEEPVFEYKAEYEEDIEEQETITEETTYTIYTVKENESLWDIAGKKEVYGDPTKWTLIYEANKNKIKKPGLIKEGMKLRIPH